MFDEFTKKSEIQLKDLHVRRFSKTAVEPAHFENCSKPVMEFLKEKYEDPFGFSMNNLTSSGKYRILGWEYDFRFFLRLYYVKQYGSIEEVWAPNKTLLRKIRTGKIDRITEIKERG